MSKQTNIADDIAAERLGGGNGGLPPDMAPWMARAILIIDGFSRWFGFVVAFLTLGIVAAMSYEIFARYLFRAPTLWAYDISRMLYGALFMLGAGYALFKGAHIRADFIYRSWSPRTQAGVDLALYLFIYFPALIVFFIYAYQFGFTSWIRSERGMDTAWMPMLWPIKMALPVGVATLLIQGISEVLKCWYAVRRNRWPQ